MWPTPITVTGTTGQGNPDKLCYGPDGALYSAYHASGKIARVTVR